MEFLFSQHKRRDGEIPQRICNLTIILQQRLFPSLLKYKIRRYFVAMGGGDGVVGRRNVSFRASSKLLNNFEEISV